MKFRRDSFTPAPARRHSLERTPLVTKPDYGIDAPCVIRQLVFVSVALPLLGIALTIAGLVHSHLIMFAMGATSVIVAVGCTAAIFLMIRSSRHGKQRVRDAVLNEFQFQGNERVLDVGCGRGLMLLGAAKRLKEGTVVGVDTWSQEDQYKNAPENTFSNAVAEGIPLDRVRLQNGDMCDMSFIASDSFDVVLSSLTIHNVSTRKGRQRAIAEMVRVLKPGGRIALVDFRHVREYAGHLERTGWVTEVKCSPVDWNMFPPVRVVYAKKRDGRLMEEV